MSFSIVIVIIIIGKDVQSHSYTYSHSCSVRTVRLGEKFRNLMQLYSRSDGTEQPWLQCVFVKLRRASFSMSYSSK